MGIHFPTKKKRKKEKKNLNSLNQSREMLIREAIIRRHSRYLLIYWFISRKHEFFWLVKDRCSKGHHRWGSCISQLHNITNIKEFQKEKKPNAHLVTSCNNMIDQDNKSNIKEKRRWKGRLFQEDWEVD